MLFLFILQFDRDHLIQSDLIQMDLVPGNTPLLLVLGKDYYTSVKAFLRRPSSISYQTRLNLCTVESPVNISAFIYSHLMFIFWLQLQLEYTIVGTLKLNSKKAHHKLFPAVTAAHLQLPVTARIDSVFTEQFFIVFFSIQQFFFSLTSMHH